MFRTQNPHYLLFRLCYIYLPVIRFIKHTWPPFVVQFVKAFWTWYTVYKHKHGNMQHVHPLHAQVTLKHFRGQTVSVYGTFFETCFVLTYNFIDVNTVVISWLYTTGLCFTKYGYMHIIRCMCCKHRLLWRHIYLITCIVLHYLL